MSSLKCWKVMCAPTVNSLRRHGPRKAGQSSSHGGRGGYWMPRFPWGMTAAFSATASPLRLRIGRAVLADVALGLALALHPHVDVRIIHGLARRAGADLEEDRVAAVLREHDLALEHVDELVLVPVPMALRRRGAGLEPAQVHAVLVEAHRVAEPPALAPDDVAAEFLGIAAGGVDRKLVDVDLRHGCHTRSMIVAVPMPTPMQSVISAVERLRRSSSSSAVPRIMAPVAPSGWPIAMAPPLTLTLSASRLNACR